MKKSWIPDTPLEPISGQLPTLFLCRPGYEQALLDEISDHLGRHETIAGASAQHEFGRGWLLIRNPPRHPAPYIFERQRLPRAELMAGASRRKLAQAVSRRFMPELRDGTGWTLHAFTAEASGADSAEKRIAGIAKEVLILAATDFPGAYGDYREPGIALAEGVDRVLQLALTDAGLWGALVASRDLSDPFPGGVHRMQPAPGAPSRSYLKIAEALDLFGDAPAPGQRVIDLGAAPGGWSYAFLAKGCDVIAVDRGSIKIRGMDDLPGRLTHLREDGLRYRPPEPWVPVDWLLSDMLIPPGVTLGLLRKWLERSWMQRFIVNIKLPQRNPYRALEPIARFLDDAVGSGAGLAVGMRQLYHDRREVTVWGRVTSQSPQQPGTGAKRGKRRKRTQPAARRRLGRRAP